jgi:hypothetical protein
MRLSRLLPAVPALLLALAPAARTEDSSADDTKAFLSPDNWEGRSDLWKVEGTTVVGETKQDPKYNTFLCSKKKYGDFEMWFKVQLRDGVGNSGVQIRSEVFDKEKFKVKGPQVDVGAGYFGSLYGEGVGGMMKASGEKAKAAKLKEFNDYHVVAKGNHITIQMNGETIVDEDFPNTPDKKPLAAEGIIAFQIHAGFPKMRVEFRDIKFTDLSKKK